MESALITVPPQPLGQRQRQRRLAAGGRPGDDQRAALAMPDLPARASAAAMSPRHDAHILTLVADRDATTLDRRHDRPRARRRRRRRAGDPVAGEAADIPCAGRAATRRASAPRWTAPPIDAIVDARRGAAARGC